MVSLVIAGLFISIIMLLVHVVLKKKISDRIMTINSISTNVILVIVLLGLVFNTDFFVDVAIIYALINFISTIAFLRYFRLTSESEHKNKKKI